MKYLCLHKLLWFLLVLLWIIIELIFICIPCILHFIWNLKLPKGNLWYDFHNEVSYWDGELVGDNNPYQTLVRRYKILDEIAKV